MPTVSFLSPAQSVLQHHGRLQPHLTGLRHLPHLTLWDVHLSAPLPQVQENGNKCIEPDTGAKEVFKPRKSLFDRLLLMCIVFSFVSK